MYTRRSTTHRGRSITVVLAAIVVLLGAAGGVATADPPALDRDPCATTLAHAAVWPGTIDGEGDGYRSVSDAYDSYLSRRPACAPET